MKKVVQETINHELLDLSYQIIDNTVEELNHHSKSDEKIDSLSFKFKNMKTIKSYCEVLKDLKFEREKKKQELKLNMKKIYRERFTNSQIEEDSSFYIVNSRAKTIKNYVLNSFCIFPSFVKSIFCVDIHDIVIEIDGVLYSKYGMPIATTGMAIFDKFFNKIK